MKKLLLTTAALMALSATANATTDTFTATLEFAQPLTLTEAQDLNFGVVTATGGGRVYSDGTATGGAQVVTPGHPALIDVNGASNAGVDVTVDTTAILDNGSGDQLTANLSAAPTLTLDNVGYASLQVDGNVVLDAITPSGTYTGDYDVTVVYQ